ARAPAAASSGPPGRSPQERNTSSPVIKEASMFAPQRRFPSGNVPASAQVDAVPRGVGNNGAASARRLGAGAFIPPFHVRVGERDGVRVVEVEGEIDILTAPTLAVALGDDRGR